MCTAQIKEETSENTTLIQQMAKNSQYSTNTEDPPDLTGPQHPSYDLSKIVLDREEIFLKYSKYILSFWTWCSENWMGSGEFWKWERGGKMGRGGGECGSWQRRSFLRIFGRIFLRRRLLLLWRISAAVGGDLIKCLADFNLLYGPTFIQVRDTWLEKTYLSNVQVYLETTKKIFVLWLLVFLLDASDLIPKAIKSKMSRTHSRTVICGSFHPRPRASSEFNFGDQKCHLSWWKPKSVCWCTTQQVSLLTLSHLKTLVYLVQIMQARKRFG